MNISRKLLMVSLVPLIMFFIGATISSFLLKSSTDATHAYISHFVDRQIILADIYRQLGYGNGIHAFKNYVLRATPSYRTRAAYSLSEARTLIQHYLALKPLAPEESGAMKELLLTVEEYIEMIPIAEQMHHNKRSISEIDRAVKVDDRPAVAALKKLQQYYIRARDEEASKVINTQTIALQITLLTFVFAFLLALIVSRKLSSTMKYSIERLIQISSGIAKGEYQIQPQYQPLPTHDELEVLGAQMLGMSKSLNETFNSLERSNLDLEQFAFVASHDLQEPIRKIGVFADRLERKFGDQLNPEATTLLNKIKNSAQSMKRLTGSLLEYARLASKELKFESVDLNKILNGAMERLERSIRETGAEVLANKLPTVWGNAEMLQLLFQNLLSNAIKFRRAGQPPIIKVTVKPTSQGKYRLSIMDNGTGFDRKHIPTILKPFGRAHNKADYPGAGLGLAFCTRILSSHGSEFEIQTDPGKGSNFSFYLQTRDKTQAH